MCKLSGWSSVPSISLKLNTANIALQEAHERIAGTEKDGFGFAQPGSLIARFRSPADFRSIGAMPNLYRNAGANLATRAFRATKHSQQGGTYDPLAPMLIHGRTSTGTVALENTHPFRLKGWTLAHNGVVTWKGDETDGHESVTCDSQHILLCLTQGVRKAKALMKRHLRGYAAFIAFSPDGRMIVARDDTAKLYAVVLSNGRWVFGTTALIAESVASCFSTQDLGAFELEENTWLEFRPNEAKPRLSHWEIGAASYEEWKHSSRSLGTTGGYDSTGRWSAPSPVKPTVPATTQQATTSGVRTVPITAGTEAVPPAQPIRSHQDPNSRWFKVSDVSDHRGAGMHEWKKYTIGDSRYSWDSSGQNFPEPATPGTVYVDSNCVVWAKSSASLNGAWTLTRFGGEWDKVMATTPQPQQQALPLPAAVSTR